MAVAQNLESSHEPGYVWLMPLFVGSGCSALIYEIVWLQSLQLVVGASAISLAVLLSIFMGGMCLGSFVFPRLVSREFHPLRVYALLEFAIGGLAVGLLFAMPAVERIYVEGVGHGQGSVLLRALVAGACLLPPTILMGATLPAIARWFENNRQGAARIGLFYSANIVGAVIGCLTAAFFLLRLYDIILATCVAVTINVGVALAALVMSRFMLYRVDQAGDHSEDNSRPAKWRAAHLGIGLSGFAALGAEVVWTRELSLLLGASVYTFALILSVFLVGLGIGSGLGSAWARRSSQPGVAFAWCQVGAALGAVWATWMMSRSIPYWPIDPSLTGSPWVGFQLDLVRVVWVVLPAAGCWGMSFPLALATAARGQDPARLVAGVYAANTLGAILGAWLLSWWAIPYLGIQHAQQFLVGLSLFAALLLAASEVVVSAKWTIPSGGLAVGILGGVLAMFYLPAPPPGLAAFGRYLATWGYQPTYLFTADGISASIAVSEFEGGARNFHVSGKVVASSEPQDMRLQRMLGHLPALICPAPKSVLVVGCGAGVTAGSFVVHPSIERIVICEIEPLIPVAASAFFGDYNHHVMQDPRVEIVFDDARHFMLTTQEKFDIITSDPIHPWVKGAAALYSTEYFQLCQAHLKPGGVATQWVPLYESSLAAVKSEVATFFDGFPQGTVWSNDLEDDGYDLVMLAQANVGPIDFRAIQSRLAQEDYADVVASLEEVDLGSLISLLKCYAGRKRDLVPWLADAELNTDRNLRLQYLAGWALNDDAAGEIRQSMRPFIHFPDELLLGPDSEIAVLKFWLESTRMDAQP